MATNIFKKINIFQIILIALLVRLVLLPLTYHGDVIVTYWWGKFAVDFGLRGFYDWLDFGGYGRPDQPVIYIYYVALIRIVYSYLHSFFWFLNINIPIFPSSFMTWFFLHGNQVLLKTLYIIADLFIIYFSYRLYKNKTLAIILTFYPPLLYNSALWGSGDSVINLFGLMSIFLFYNRRFLLGTILIILSILFKSSLIIFLPILFVVFLKSKPRLKDLMIIIIISLIILYIVSSPFSPIEVNPVIWLFNTMTKKILPGCMNQLTSNAFNFWALLYGIIPRVDDLFRTPSIVFCIIAFIPILVNLYKNFNQQNILFTIVNITLVSFSFLTRMHERYSFPALIPLLLLSFYKPVFIKYFIIISITHILNVYNWWWYPDISFIKTVLQFDITIRIISLINLVLCLKLYFKQLSWRY